jgi:hypothetical protein
MSPLIRWPLTALRQALKVDADRIVREIEHPRNEGTEREIEKDGVPPEEAARRTIVRPGSPQAIAAAFDAESNRENGG